MACRCSANLDQQCCEKGSAAQGHGGEALQAPAVAREAAAHAAL